MGLIPIFAINVRASSLDRVGVIEAGADDCLPEPLSIPELIIRLKILLHRSTATRKQNAFTKNRSFGLTKTECRVAELIADGRKVDQIAAELHVSRNTVRSHLRGIFNKTGVRRQVELMLLLLTHWNSNTVADLPSRLNPSSARLEDEVRAEGTRYASWPPAS
jgi:DNA-binding NarL/FixJ family response regulator